MVVYMKLYLTSLFWAGAFVAGKALAGSVSPFTTTVIRFAVAFVALLLYAVISNQSQLRWTFSFPRIVYLTTLGLTGIVGYNILLFDGLSYMEASKASMIIASSPAFVAILAVIIADETFSARLALGVLSSFAGAVVVISDGELSSLDVFSARRGEMLIFAAMALWVAYTIVGRKSAQHINSYETITFSSFIGVLVLVPLWISKTETAILVSISPSHWMLLVYLGLIATALGFLWYVEGIRIVGSSRAALFVNIVPVNVVLISFVLWGKIISAEAAAGMFLVGVGSLLSITSRRS